MQIHRDHFDWSWQGAPVRLGVTRMGAGPTILMLPALSSISTRGEMRPLQERLAVAFTTVAIDWPGFGDTPRPAVRWQPDAYRAFLPDVLEQAVTRAHGARPASIRFVVGELDPMTSREEFLDAARQVTEPILLIYGADTPTKSKAEMAELAALPNVRTTLLPAGKLAIHEEFAEEVASALRGLLLCA